MPLKIVRNDITRMNVDAVINTAASTVNVGRGCDWAIYTAAGFDQLLDVRRSIGDVPEGEAFITPGFNLPSKFIIHAVSPLYIDGESGEEEKLRNCYRNSLNIALKHELESIAFPLISTGSFGYPREEGMRIAVDEINAFLMSHNMLIYIVVFDPKTTELGKRIAGDLDSYIDDRYIQQLHSMPQMAPRPMANFNAPAPTMDRSSSDGKKPGLSRLFKPKSKPQSRERNINSSDMVPPVEAPMPYMASSMGSSRPIREESYEADYEAPYHDSLDERIAHLSDTFSQYLLYLIERNGMSNSDVYKRAVVDKKVFSKIKNNPSYHPNKITAMCLCVGAQLCLDDTRDLLARAGYALSPCDKTDIIFSYFIEHEVFDIIEIDIALEEHGLPCLIQ